MYKKLGFIKKGIALLLSIVLIAIAFAGCAGKGNDADETTKTTTVKTTTAKATTEAETEAEKGITFPLEEEIKLSIYVVIGDQLMSEDSLLATELKKKTNIDFEFVQTFSSDAVEKQSVMFASGDLPDIMCLKGEQPYVYNQDKTPLFLNLKDYYNDDKMPNLKAWVEKYPITADYFIDDSSNIFGVPQLLNDAVVTEGFITQKELLDKYSGGKLKTYDDLFNYLKGWKGDNPEKYPWTCISWGLGGWYLIGVQLVMWHNGWSAVDFDYDASEYKVMPYKQEYKDCITWLAECYKEGLIDPNFTSNADAQFFENFSSGKSILAFNYYGNVVNFTTDARKAQDNEKITFVAVPYPELSNGKPSTFLGYNAGATGGWYRVISNDTQYPDIAVALLDYMLSEDVSIMMNYGVEGKTYDVDSAGYEVARKDIDFKTTGIPSMLAPISYNAAFGTDEMGMLQTESRDNLSSNPDALNQRRPGVKVSEDEAKKIADITGPAETFIHENVVKFVAGVKPISEWDSFIDEVKKLNLEYVADTYNSYIK